MRKNIVIVFVLFMFQIAQAQEVVLPTAGLDVKKHKSEMADFDMRGNNLELPFLEDFSNNSSVPNPKKWQDYFVNIDLCSSKNPPSVGAAMFDALTNMGEFYTKTYNFSHTADILTSRPINLYYPNNQSIYFSFFYQPAGILDRPETKDSLILEFYDISQDKWDLIWYAPGDALKDFEQVIIQIYLEKYLQDGFQFRFRNVVSIASSADISMVANCDFWFVDYIRLDKNRNANDKTIKELAFQYPLRLKIDNYDMVPYEHYKYALAKKYDLNHNCTVKYRNNDSKVRTIDSLYLIFKEKKQLTPNYKLSLGAYNVPSSQNIKTDFKNMEFSFPNLSAEILEYDIESVLITNSSDSVFNNRNIVSKPISYYYAYDDGSAEGGYDLYGDGTLHASVATKFYSYKSDTLTGISMFLNRTFNDQQPDYFYLMIWKSDKNTGLPGELILEKEGLKIDKSKLAMFQEFLIDTTIILADTFYIGWKKASTKHLNLGIDLNSTSTQHKYYNLNGTWQKSIVAGDVLLRPIFGKQIITNIDEKTSADIKIYPNPAKDFITIQADDLQKMSVTITDLSGKIIINQEINDNILNTSMLKSGVYIIRIFEKTNIISTQKLIIY